MAYRGVIRFSDVLKAVSVQPTLKHGCLVDTSVLFAASYPPDKFNTESEELFEYFAELEIPLLTNVNVRSEFIDLHRRVSVPDGLSDLYTGHGKALNSVVYAKLQSLYSSLTLARKTGQPYKFSEDQIKSWRQILHEHYLKNQDGWLQFCANYLQGKIERVWDKTCDELGVNFLSLREEDKPDWLVGELTWPDMASIVGRFGIGSFDAMIVNLFLNSRFVGVVTADRDIVYVLECIKPKGKCIIVPDKLSL